jgi:2OG-Fe dioxygenase
MNRYEPLETYRNELATKRYTVLPPDIIITTRDRLKIRSLVFGEASLEADVPHMHPNRRRADAVLRFDWSGDDVDMSLGPNPSPDPENRQIIRYTANYRGDREYKRLKVLDVPELTKLLKEILHLVPRDARREKGLLGVHAFRTSGNIVSSHHRDGSVDAPVDWVISYIVSKHGDGAQTQLTLDQEGTLLITRIALAEGQLVMHHDSTYFHYVTPLVAKGPGAIQRDAMIVTIRPEFD